MSILPKSCITVGLFERHAMSVGGPGGFRVISGAVVLHRERLPPELQSRVFDRVEVSMAPRGGGAWTSVGGLPVRARPDAFGFSRTGAGAFEQGVAVALYSAGERFECQAPGDNHVVVDRRGVPIL